MTKVKFIFTFVIISLIGAASAATSVVPTEDVKWISFNELAKVHKADPRPILVDVYTTWCGWCKVMDQKTYSNQKLANYLNEKYYAIKFDAESKADIEFNGKTYSYDNTKRIHQLALYLTFGRLEFPHTVLLQSPGSQPAPISGYLKPSQLEMPIKFFGENASDKQTFVEFNKAMKKEW